MQRKRLPKDSEHVVRANVLPLLAADQRSQNAIAKAAGIDPSRFSRFVQGKGGITLDEAFSLAPALGVPMRAIVRRPTDEVREARLIPVILLKDFPTRVEPSEAPQKMIGLRHRWEETYRDDPRLFALDIQEPFGDALPGDIGLFSDAQKPRAQDMMIVAIDGEASLAKCVLVNGHCAAALPSGEVHMDFRYYGRRVVLIRR